MSEAETLEEQIEELQTDEGEAPSQFAKPPLAPIEPTKLKVDEIVALGNERNNLKTFIEHIASKAQCQQQIGCTFTWVEPGADPSTAQSQTISLDPNVAAQVLGAMAERQGSINAQLLEIDS